MLNIPEKYNASTLIDANLEAGRADKTAIICGDERITYRELLARISRMGRALRRLGVRGGERVILALGDTPIFPIAFFGAIRIGAVPCPINPLFKADDYRFFIEDAGAAVVVTDTTYIGKVEQALTDFPRPVTVVAPAQASGRRLPLEDLLAAEDDTLDPADTHRDDLAFWLYSGGSTGRPKAVMHGHQDIPWTCATYASQVLGITEHDVCFARVLFHAYGLGGGVTFPFWAGATSVLMAERPTPQALIDLIAAARPTLLFLVPTLYNTILSDPASSTADLSSLRCCISAAEPLAPDVWRRWRETFGHEILDGLGSTEMLHIFCSNVPGEVRPGSSGKPVPGYELRLVGDQDGGHSDADIGTLQVRGGSAFSGYWRQRDKTRNTLLGDWVSTGDRYRRDADGYFWYAGRTDDLIKIGGEWVSPIQIENTLVEHEAVSEAAVVAVSIDNAQRIKATLVLCADRDGTTALTRELQEWCKSRLQRYQYPHVIDYVDDLPKTVTGKVQRFKLREGN
jgi:benzoate-CoA ligase family protein